MIVGSMVLYWWPKMLNSLEIILGGGVRRTIWSSEPTKLKGPFPV